MAEPPVATRRDDDAPSIGELVDLVTTYAKQETIGPLRGAGRWLGFGAAGAALLGLGLMLVLLGGLRLLQSEWERSAEGALSWLSYTIVLVACIVLLVVTLSRINKRPLNEGGPR